MESAESTVQKYNQSTGLQVILQDILDAIEDEIVIIGTEHRIIYTNSVLRNRVHEGEESPIGRHCYDVLYNRKDPCSEPLWDCLLKRVVEKGKQATVIHPVSFPDAIKYFKITAFPLRDENDNITAVIELRKDVTAERELETQIVRRHHQLLALSQISSALSGSQDLDTTLSNALDSVLELINGDIGGILLVDTNTKSLHYHVHRGLSTKYAETIRISVGEGIAGAVAETGEPIILEDISKDKRTANPDLIDSEGLRGFVSIPLKAKERVVGVMNVASHVAGRFSVDEVSLLNSIGDYLGSTIEQARLHERLARLGERYRTLLRFSLTAQEDERKRIARELHDDTSQAITSMTLSLQAIITLAEMKGIDDKEFLNMVKETHAFAVHAGYEVVRIMKELRPTLLDELGMAAAIHRYAKDTLEPLGIKVSAEFIGTEGRFPSEVEITMFRVAQGLIGNIMEHSEAKNVSIKLQCDEDQCEMVIEDDGKGFDVSKLTKVEKSGRGAGLFTMRERLHLAGGEGFVESEPGKGTKGIARLPIHKDSENAED
ncbi:MAG: GAF domain-containing protein [Dehalococcoidales bacterium]|nr:MAG: GAF domain-containing protein [Dehalococcoidales bacterium]